ncbi:hypothetical protein WJX79_006763 [Trebouxia sp. C0005]
MADVEQQEQGEKPLTTADLLKSHSVKWKATEGVFHCVCGKNFATAISHETRYYIHVQVDTVHIVLFKSKDNPFSVSEA